jgi:hypothetical protein
MQLPAISNPNGRRGLPLKPRGSDVSDRRQKSEQTDRITLTPEELSSPVTRQSFWRKALYFVQETLGNPGILPTIRPGTDEWDAWRQYFERHLGFTPTAMQLVIDGQAEAMTVPVGFPQMFDSTFAESASWGPRPVPKPLPRHMRDSLEQLLRRHGANWGIRQAAIPKSKKHQPLSDDDLRAMYPPKRPAHETEAA